MHLGLQNRVLTECFVEQRVARKSVQTCKRTEQRTALSIPFFPSLPYSGILLVEREGWEKTQLSVRLRGSLQLPPSVAKPPESRLVPRGFCRTAGGPLQLVAKCPTYSHLEGEIAALPAFCTPATPVCVCVCACDREYTVFMCTHTCLREVCVCVCLSQVQKV